MLSSFFRRTGARSDASAEAARRVKTIVRGLMGDDASVTVSEILCPDPACPELETVILLGRPGRPTAAVKIRKPLTEVSADDVVAALDEMIGKEPS